MHWLHPDEYPPLRRRKRPFVRLRYPLFLALVIAAWFFLPGHGDGTGGTSQGDGSAAESPAALARMPAQAAQGSITRDDIARIDQETIDRYNLTIDWDLQRFIAEKASQYKLYYGAIVVMDAGSGDILALYGQGLGGEQDCGLGLDPDLGASIFKLVTAVAALEQAGFTPESVFSYNGSAYTLYKKQLTNLRNRWTEDISLADAFARSNNVVFGKLGCMHLGQQPLVITADKMGFGKSPLQEISITPSESYLPQDEYGIAELACGFNRHTRISPLHAAQMVTAVLNDGFMLTPRLLRGRGGDKTRAMQGETARALHDMMERTVKRGTVSKTFRGSSSDRVLKHLAIGGKSGSINGSDPEGRRNWFAGYARHKETGEGITIGCLLILNDRFWVEADTLSRLVIRRYFSLRNAENRTAQAGGVF
jgi:membrane peptidoglycan carboxypeptidase